MAPNTYQPSAGQVNTFFRPVVDSRRRVTVEPSESPRPFRCRLRFQRWPSSRMEDPTPIEARASRGEVRGSGDPRGLETHLGPRTGLLMTSDVAEARP